MSTMFKVKIIDAGNSKYKVGTELEIVVPVGQSLDSDVVYEARDTCDVASSDSDAESEALFTCQSDVTDFSVLYNVAHAKGDSTFKFKGKDVLTAYARYVLLDVVRYMGVTS